MIQSKVSGFQIADTDGQQEKRHAVKTEQFKTEEQTADWTVGHTAEYPSVMAVKIIFNRKAVGTTSPAMAFAMIFIPVPR